MVAKAGRSSSGAGNHSHPAAGPRELHAAMREKTKTRRERHHAMHMQTHVGVTTKFYCCSCYENCVPEPFTLCFNMVSQELRLMGDGLLGLLGPRHICCPCSRNFSLLSPSSIVKMPKPCFLSMLYWPSYCM